MFLHWSTTHRSGTTVKSPLIVSVCVCLDQRDASNDAGQWEWTGANGYRASHWWERSCDGTVKEPSHGWPWRETGLLQPGREWVKSLVLYSFLLIFFLCNCQQLLEFRLEPLWNCLLFTIAKLVLFQVRQLPLMKSGGESWDGTAPLMPVV